MHLTRKQFLQTVSIAAAGIRPGGTAAQAVGEPTGKMWDFGALAKPPKTAAAPGIEAPSVKTLFYDGLPWKGRPTRVFAYYGAPAQPAGTRVPAMVLVHGGGGTAFDSWIRLWNSRGYAAIAMDT